MLLAIVRAATSFVAALTTTWYARQQLDLNARAYFVLLAVVAASTWVVLGPVLGLFAARAGPAGKLAHGPSEVLDDASLGFVLPRRPVDASGASGSDGSASGNGARAGRCPQVAA